MLKFLLVLSVLFAVTLPKFLSWYYSITVDEVDQNYDFIIVGGGTTGSILANRLSQEKSWKVLVLEAGGSDQPDPRISVPVFVPFTYFTKNDWAYEGEFPGRYEGYDVRKVIYPRGKVLGGCTAINSNYFVRGSPHDYDKWAQLGAVGWAHDDVREYFSRFEDARLLNVSKTSRGQEGEVKLSYAYVTPLLQAHSEAAVEAGSSSDDYNSGVMNGFHVPQVTVFDGSRQSASVAFLRPVAKQRRDRLHIVTGAHVSKIMFQQDDDQTLTAHGVTYVKNGKTAKVTAKKEVILSAGVIGTPQLLMLSGVGPKEHLEKFEISSLADLPGVGSNFQDHSTAFGCFKADNLDKSSLFDNAVGISSVWDYFVHSNGPLSAPSAIDGFVFLRTKHAKDQRPDIQLKVVSAQWDDFGGNGPFLNKVFNQPDKFVKKKQDYSRKHNLHPTCDFFIAVILLHPLSTGHVKLRSSDYQDYPEINPNFIDEKADVDTLVEGFRYLEKFESSSAYKKLKARMILFSEECDEHPIPRPKECYKNLIHEAVGGFHHPVGSAKMGGKADEMSVTDPRLRVHKTKNLRVADASIMPNLPSGNTMAPCYMIGEKAAHMIKEDWGR